MPRKIGPTTPHGYFIHQRGAIITDHTLFTDENDHNPRLARVCPKCGGKPIIIVDYTGPDGRHVHGDGVCSRCRGLGVIDEPGEWFSNGANECVVRPNPYHYLQCPGCGRQFSHYDPNVWTGKRHTCGQKIRLDLDDQSTEQYGKREGSAQSVLKSASSPRPPLPWSLPE